MPYFFLAEGREDDQPCLAHYWSTAESLDQAVEQALAWLPQDRRLTEAALTQVWSSGESQVPLGFYPTAVDGLYENAERHYWEAPEDESRFVFPRGVLPWQEDGQFDPDQIREGWRRVRDLEPGQSAAEAVVDGRRLETLLESTCALLPAPCRRLIVRLQGGDEDEPQTQEWIAEALPMQVDAWTFVSLYGELLVDNGRASLVLPADDDSWRLELTDDKTLLWTCQDPEAFQKIVDHWEQEGLPEVEHLATLADDCAHCHYFATSRADVPAALAAVGFRLRRVF